MAAGCWAGPSSAKAVNSPAPHCVKEERDDAPETRNTPETMAGATVSPETTTTSTEIVEPTSNDTEEAKVGVVAPECTAGVDGGTDTTPSVSSELGSPKADTSAFVGEAAALSLEPVTPEAQETARTKPKPDTELTVGTRILVDGMGEGTYTHFKASWVGANTHTIEFDSGKTKKMNLRGLEWHIISEPAAVEESDGAVTAGTSASAREEPLAVVESSAPAVPPEAAVEDTEGAQVLPSHSDERVENEALQTATGASPVQQSANTVASIDGCDQIEITTAEAVGEAQPVHVEDDRESVEDDILDMEQGENTLSAIERALEADVKHSEAKAAADAKAAVKAAAKATKEASRKEKANTVKWQTLLTKLELREAKAAAQAAAEADKRAKAEAKRAAATAKEIERLERQLAKEQAAKERAAANAAATEAKLAEMQHEAAAA